MVEGDKKIYRKSVYVQDKITSTFIYQPWVLLWYVYFYRQGGDVWNPYFF